MAVFATDELSQKQYKRLRRYVGASAAVLPDPLAEEYFEEALELYPNDTAKMVNQAKVIALQEIRGNAAMLGKYAHNQHTEDLTKVFDNLSKMLDEAKKLVEEVADPIEPTVLPIAHFGLATGRRGY